ncbi:hypothetical protein DVH05_024794 [Phytophthora capsici]|nr:hypothetical protein DVH05_008438 [Phytophthora capsici]KAG1699789.1 hypothetical protein DVH05_012682 [Phytophthora capsici]KAG1708110.1 hypothetical protein DVH05_024794 [Phytophthora capsici]
MWPSLFQRLQEIRALRASEQLVVPGRNDGDTGDAPPPDSGRHVVVPRRAPQSGLTPTLPRPQILEATPAINCSTREPSGENGEEGFARDDAALPAPVAPTGAVNPSAVDGYIDGDVSNIKPPAAVTNAIAAFPEVPGLVLKPPTEKETSYIYKWGVRVEVVEGGVPVRHWICLADDTCRRNGTNFTLSCDRTSKPANHLAVAHRVVSVRTKAQLGEKRKREDEIQHLRSSSLFRTNPRRFALLMETLRIINNNLPFRFGEYRESRIVEALLKKEDVQIIINAAKVTRAIIELYSSTRIEIMSVLGDSKLGSFGNFVIMSDFWTCKITHRKYMGVRVYFVDSNWEFRSILLGVRRFSPSYGDRETGIQGPYKAWTLQLLGDFGLTPSDFFGATSDSGPDVKNLLKRVLKLKWEWCMAHMAHAATKEACGMNGDAQKSRNPGMTELIARIKKTIFDVQSIEKTGDLFAALCRTQTSTSTTQLLSYAANRFLSITGSIRRILEKWGALVDWYDERAHLARRQRISPPIV